MRNTLIKSLAIPTVALLAAFAVASNSAGKKLVREISDLKPPVYDRTKKDDTAYRDAYKAQLKQYEDQRNDLILQLYQTDPNNSETPKLMVDRWVTLDTQSGDTRVKIDEFQTADIDKVLANHPPVAISAAGDYAKIFIGLRTQRDPTGMDKTADAFVSKYPKSEFSPKILMQAAFSSSEDEKLKLFREIITKYPNYKSAPMIKGALNQSEMVGKPFRLSFNDAVNGNRIDLASLKGKVVLVDFWATWCGPCVAEMPHVKQIFQDYHPKGLEIVGVSLDVPEKDGGLTKLKDYVAKNQIPWPMYFQGNGWDSGFSSGMGIMSIPAMFLIDKNGNFQGTVDPRQPDFLQKLDSYLAK